VGRDHLGSAWSIAAFPCAVIVIMTLSISLLGDWLDWLRDGLAPLSDSSRCPASHSAGWGRAEVWARALARRSSRLGIGFIDISIPTMNLRAKERERK
jgi:hypothetical protein